MLDNVSPVTCFLCGESAMNARDPLLLLQLFIQLTEIYLLCLHGPHTKTPQQKTQHLNTSSIYICLSLIFPPYLDLDSRLFIFAMV